MKLSKVFAASAAAFAMSVASAAAPLAIEDGGDLGINPFGVGYLASGKGTSVYDFTLVDNAPAGFFSTFDVVATLTSLIRPVTLTGYTITGTAFNQVGTLSPNQSFVTFTGLSAGAYKLSLTTTSAGSTALLTGTVTATATVTPVPEAGSIAMAVAGLGVIGLVAARRRKV
jgi:hypothetical protein